jgi:hypothetical protein
MPRGGKRAGAGRKPGSATKKTRAIADAVARSGLMPLDYMLEVMRDTSADEKRRDDLAKAAAPYVHPRLSAVELKKPPIDLSRLSDDELAQLRELYDEPDLPPQELLETEWRRRQELQARGVQALDIEVSSGLARVLRARGGAAAGIETVVQ